MYNPLEILITVLEEEAAKQDDTNCKFLLQALAANLEEKIEPDQNKCEHEFKFSINAAHDRVVLHCWKCGFLEMWT